MKDLTTRIADIVDDHGDWIYRCNCGHQGGYSEHLAQVIINELNLRPEHGQRSNPTGPLWGSDNRHTVTRYVTDWKAADE